MMGERILKNYFARNFAFKQFDWFARNKIMENGPIFEFRINIFKWKYAFSVLEAYFAVILTVSCFFCVFF